MKLLGQSQGRLSESPHENQATKQKKGNPVGEAAQEG